MTLVTVLPELEYELSQATISITKLPSHFLLRLPCDEDRSQSFLAFVVGLVRLKKDVTNLGVLHLRSPSIVSWPRTSVGQMGNVKIATFEAKSLSNAEKNGSKRFYPAKRRNFDILAWNAFWEMGTNIVVRKPENNKKITENC